MTEPTESIRIYKRTKQNIKELKATGQTAAGFLDGLVSLALDIKIHKKVTVKLDR